MKKYILVITLLSCAFISKAQYNETIRTARPGQAFGPFTTGKKVFQIQTGVTYSGYGFDRSDDGGNATDWLMALRYGLWERFEIRSAFNYNRFTSTIGENEFSDNGLSAWIVGVRYNLRDGHGKGMNLGVQLDTRLNAVSEAYRPGTTEPRIMLLHSQKLSNTFALTTNWAVRWEGEDHNAAGFYVVNVSFPLSQKFGSFIENYGSISDGDWDNRWDTGLSYLVNNDFQLDMSFGYGKNDGVSDYFIDAGISWRTDLYKNGRAANMP